MITKYAVAISFLTLNYCAWGYTEYRPSQLIECDVLKDADKVRRQGNSVLQRPKFRYRRGKSITITLSEAGAKRLVIPISRCHKTETGPASKDGEQVYRLQYDCRKFAKGELEIYLSGTRVGKLTKHTQVPHLGAELTLELSLINCR